MRYTLKHQLPGETFHRITQGKRWVGRVWRHADTGQWYGKIGDHEGTGSNADAAFNNVGAKALGFDSLQALLQHNRNVGTQRRRQRAGAALLVQGMLSDDRKTRDVAYQIFGDILTGEKKL